MVFHVLGPAPAYARFHCPTEIGSATFFAVQSFEFGFVRTPDLVRMLTSDFHQSVFSGLNTVSNSNPKTA